nr:precorrin-6A/cobalt-precorrin-6A reductase [Hyphomicrobium sp.]
MRVLILGGTGEANRLAAAVSDCAYDAVYSYAGRTAIPAPQPLPTRTGGFGGADGLAEFLRKRNALDSSNRDAFAELEAMKELPGHNLPDPLPEKSWIYR